ncbi:MAG: hypothetical protein EBY86_03720 [Acidimicrobiia bacterium]|nr:hypothetical protein [Acidimicrobiia bacterium]
MPTYEPTGVVEVQSLVIGWRFFRRRCSAISSSVIAIVTTCAIGKFVVITVVEFIGVNLETFQTFKVVGVNTFRC